jgi:flagellar FliL protein
MAQAAAEEKAQSLVSGASAPSAGGGNKLVLILTGVNLVATLGMLGVLFVSFQKERTKPAVEDISAVSAPAAVTEAKGGEQGTEAKGGAHGAAPAAKKAVDYGRMITLDQFTVNLSAPGSATAKYVRVNISLEVPTDDAEGEVTSKMPQVRNVIIDLFNSKRPSDLATAEGRDYLKEEIRNALNGFLINGKVKGVFFTNFALTS